MNGGVCIRRRKIRWSGRASPDREGGNLSGNVGLRKVSNHRLFYPKARWSSFMMDKALLASPNFWCKSVLNFIAGTWKLMFSRWMDRVALIASQNPPSSSGKVLDVGGDPNFRLAFGRLRGFVNRHNRSVSSGGERGFSTAFFVTRS